MSGGTENLSGVLKTFARSVGVRVIYHTHLEPEMMSCAIELIHDAVRDVEATKYFGVRYGYCFAHGLSLALKVEKSAIAHRTKIERQMRAR